MTNCFLALGSNIAPRTNMRQALDLLNAMPRFDIEAISPWYETEPWGITDQSVFLNLVVQGRWAGDAHALLRATQGIEQSLHRVRLQRNGPRTMDIDILLFGDEQHDTPELHIPHPGLLERDFMLLPLLDLAPDAVLPGSGTPLHGWRDRLRYRCIRKRLETTL